MTDCGLLRIDNALDRYLFIKPANVGPGWRNAATPESTDFARLKQIAFRHLLSGHGEPLKEAAHEQFSQTFKELFNV